ncbi:FtsX-like permease family protein [Sediminitomix flava]|uniref:Putative ABC transport system permease protein n=1 Tax=Sediminitomix flava TaxID=379075 RepID=A0A315Z8Y6_SEDFL|nr:FtsX-like permease family protein [Sediminitomix flava]PWJ40909.1 putative ABC transport system permease protein [Sediminitomix flava]
MRLFKLSFKNILSNPLTTTLNLILFGFGICIISILLLVSKQVEDQLDKNQAGIGMVVGAKGSPLQLILSSLYHLDVPTGNIKLSEAEKLKKNPLIKSTIPMALGDNYKGYRIIGTDHSYPELYKAEIAEGRLWKKNLEVTVGAKVAKYNGMKLGDTFHGSHGIGASAHDHGDHSFVVTGILKPTGTVIDQLILTNVASVWAVHGMETEESHDEQEEHEGNEHAEHNHDEHEGHDHAEHNHDEHEGHNHAEHNHDEHEEHDHAEHNHDKHEGHDHAEHNHDEHEGHDHGDSHVVAKEDLEITSMLVKFRSPMGAITIPRNINANTNMQAAVPSYETARLFSILGVGFDALKILGVVLIFISALSVFISLFNSLKERQYELAYMRVLGARRTQVLLLILWEGITISIIGFIFGILLSRLGMMGLSYLLEENFNYSLNLLVLQPDEIWMFFVSVGIGLVAAILPAISVYKADISKILAEE